MTDATIFLIWSHEHNGWWKPGGWGYTDRIYQAGRYHEAVASEICAKAALGWTGELPPEVMVPEAEDEARLVGGAFLNAFMADRVREATERAIAERKAGV